MIYLVTDDSKMARKMVIKILKSYIGNNKHTIIEATNGEEAISLYKEHNPDLCFMDLTMPILDGFTATFEIVKYDSEAKILVVSADIQKGSMQKAKENGAIGFINKPIKHDDMKAILTKLGHI